MAKHRFIMLKTRLTVLSLAPYGCNAYSPPGNACEAHAPAGIAGMAAFFTTESGDAG